MLKSIYTITKCQPHLVTKCLKLWRLTH